MSGNLGYMCKYILKTKGGKIINPWCRNVGPETKKVATPEAAPGYQSVCFRSFAFQNISASPLVIFVENTRFVMAAKTALAF